MPFVISKSPGEQTKQCKQTNQREADRANRVKSPFPRKGDGASAFVCIGG